MWCLLRPKNSPSCLFDQPLCLSVSKGEVQGWRLGTSTVWGISAKSSTSALQTAEMESFKKSPRSQKGEKTWCQRFSVDLLPKPGCWESCLLFAHFIGFFSKINKSQCQLYKRLAEPIIPLFLVWSRKGVSTIDVITRGQSTAMFLCIGPFSAWWQPTKEPGDPRSSLLLTSEKSVFCNFYSQTVEFCQWHVIHILETMYLRIHLRYFGTFLVHPVMWHNFNVI